MATSEIFQRRCGDVSRRDLVKGATVIAGWAFLFGPDLEALAQQARKDAEQTRWIFLTDAEAAFLVAAVNRLIPEDDYPSASQAGVVDFLDLQLATEWGAGAGLYLKGPIRAGSESQGYQLSYPPAELYRRAIASIDAGIGGDGFAALAAAEQDRILMAMASGDDMLGDIPAKTFFEQLRQHTIEGYFADPAHGGNRDAVAWQMIGFPGAHAYYLTEVDRYNMVYNRRPMGKAYSTGQGEPASFQRILNASEGP